MDIEAEGEAGSFGAGGEVGGVFVSEVNRDRIEMPLRNPDGGDIGGD